ncbi:protein THEM6 [Lethenteron reissneri]|uniref:protein THEM6 n=1 Tax=Lethenteron reissneri TaxID=7753 RepID=UPI002AB6E1B6|nr:protein THEM6 [Lethenteron reissneri]XP_061420014.1 protein THEM6 [Lethenteron reissneri]XP_061420015.1 protein THEM6 [Lethenteron reissneri]
MLLLSVVLLVLVVLLALFVGADAWYFVRMLMTVGAALMRRQEKDVLKEHGYHGIVLLSDIDHMGHMNNARYLRECDFARTALCITHGIIKAMRELRGGMVLGASTIRYRRSLRFLQRFVIRSRILCWDEKAFYVEQRVIMQSDGFVAAIALARLNVTGTSPEHILRLLCRRAVQGPDPPPEVLSWLEYNRQSSEMLRNSS